MRGENDIEEIYYYTEKDVKTKIVPDVEYFVKPDMVIIENGIGRPK